jgi:c-di-GMP-binding flagellar brake protein YcgR
LFELTNNYDQNSSRKKLNMSQSENAPRAAKFSDMDLRVGQRVQLVIHAPVLQKHYTSLIGYVENEFIMLRVPQEDGWIAHLKEGMNVEVRLFSGVSVFTFESRIDTLLLNPRNYMLMRFPDQIHEVRMRAHARVRTNKPVDIVEAASAAVKATGFHLHDLSGGGASIVGPTPLGPVGARVRLGFRFHLEATNLSEQVELNATIQSADKVERNDPGAHATVYQHGVQFDVVEPRILLWVHELQ